MEPKKQRPVRCDVCQDTGYICKRCEMPDGDCTCTDEDGPDLMRCPEVHDLDD
jgi:hypothetical protein